MASKKRNHKAETRAKGAEDLTRAKGAEDIEAEEIINEVLETASESDENLDDEEASGPYIEGEADESLGFAETEEPAFIEAEGTDDEEIEEDNDIADIEGTELDSFEAAEIEEKEFVADEQLESIIESILFASDRPVSLASLKLVFKGTNIKTDRLRRAMDQLAVEYAGGRRGVTLEEVPGGWQLRTKIDNMNFLRRTLKARTFRLSGPALEVLSIVAYKQPVVKHEIDEIRGVESGHLLRALMEKHLVSFEGKSDLPGRPMQYGTTKKFLEIFSLRNLKELPTLSQIDELLPEGIGEEDEVKKQTLSDVTSAMSEQIGTGSFSQGEEELEKIQEQLEKISTSSDFFEQEKQRQREQRDRDRAQNIRDALAVGEHVSTRDKNWLTKFEEGTLNAESGTAVAADTTAEAGAAVETTVAEVEADVIEGLSTEEVEAVADEEEPIEDASIG